MRVNGIHLEGDEDHAEKFSFVLAFSAAKDEQGTVSLIKPDQVIRLRCGRGDNYRDVIRME